MDEESDFHDSDYIFNGDLEKEDMDNATKARAKVEIEEEAKGVGSNAEIESKYAGSDELQSCFSTNKKALVPVRPSYAEFNDEVDMKNLQFKIGMKFRNFKQFKKAVKNYKIKNRCVMNFNLNNNKKV